MKRKNLKNIDQERQEKPKEINKFRKAVYDWNDAHPLDLWWRRKHKIPFGSKDHLEMDFISMRIEYEEDLWIEEVSKKNKRDENSEEDKAIYGALNEKDAINVVKMNKGEVDDEFDNLDINNIK